MISIAGGTYYERCIWPEWNYMWGSGLRAAAAISNICKDVKLFTYCDYSSIDQLTSIADAFSITVLPQGSSKTIKFSYFHGLSIPIITPPLHSITKEKSLLVKDDVILRYGMLEGDAIVEGSRVIYDPQSAEQVEPFHSNGSTAKELSIVANMRECRMLTGESELPKIFNTLLSKHLYDVAVIKRGSLGTSVATKDNPSKIQTFPAYKTHTVWPIGSGDIFSAIFSYYWGIAKEDPFAAAQLASLATASFCSNQVLPISEDFGTNPVGLAAIIPKAKGVGDKNKIYLAGPFFNISQRWLIEEARNELLNQGMKVFSPLHDVGRGIGPDIAPADLAGLDDSAVVLAIVDGLDPGTIFEIGYARAKNIPVICLMNAEKEEDLKMMEGSGCLMVDDFTTAIYQTVWKFLEI